MDCLICRQAALTDGFTSVDFQRGEFHVRVQNVPARVCPKCGDALVGEEVALVLLGMAEQAALQGLRDSTLEY